MKRNWHIWIVLGLLLSSGLINAAWAWDGDWTDGKSGKGDIFYDPDSSQGKAGTDPPQKFLTPNPRDYVDVDPEELDDYYRRRGKDYTPYALARITQELRYNELVIPKGYYLIKPGDVNDGSPRIKLAGLNASTAAAQPSAGSTAAAPKTKSMWTLKRNVPVHQVFVLKRQGKVVGVVPINRMEAYKPPRGEENPKHAVAWVEMEDRHPVLKFYYKKQLYCTDFQ